MLPSGLVRGGDEKTFDAKDYAPVRYEVNRSSYPLDEVAVKVIQAKPKRTSGGSNAQGPHFCRAWFYIEKKGSAPKQIYYRDMDPVGSSYGLFVPKSQPSPNFLLFLKIGDYDGRLLIVDRGGNLANLPGGLYLIDKKRNILFSEYHSDVSGLAVVGLASGEVFFQSTKIPSIQQWYEKDGEYFFTESEWKKDGSPAEKPGVIHVFDSKNRRLVRKEISADFLKAAKHISYDFDPKKSENCR